MSGMRPRIIAFQQHNSEIWDHVALSLVSAMQWLKAVESVTGTEQSELYRAIWDAREVASAGRAKGQRLLAELSRENPEQFSRCRAGLEPWPDEDPVTFTGRCNCHDQCLHARGVEDLGPIGVCNCPGVRPSCPVPGHPRAAA